MSHSWRLLADPPAEVVPSVMKQSDLHICSRCGSLALSEVGLPPGEDFLRTMNIEDCDAIVVRSALDS